MAGKNFNKDIYGGILCVMGNKIVVCLH